VNGPPGDNCRPGQGGNRDIDAASISVTCQDCARRSRGRHLQYEQSCPIGRAIDERSAADRRWFEDHPFTDVRRRPVHRSEGEELHMWGLLPAVGHAAGWVTVRRLGDGLRARSFAEVFVVLPVSGAR
jgi:hypothetical protein